MNKETYIAMVKKKLSSAGVLYEDISKTTFFDLLVRDRYRVVVLDGTVKEIDEKVSPYLFGQNMDVDIVAFVVRQKGRPHIIWYVERLDDDVVISMSPAIFNKKKKKVVVSREDPILNFDAWYTPAEIARYNFIGDVSAKNIKELISSGYLKAKIVGEGTQKRYWIKGEWVVEYQLLKDNA